MDVRTIAEMLEEGESLDEFLLKCRQDPAVFMNRLVGLSHPVKDFHVEWFNSFLNNNRSVVISFRSSGKTEVLGVIFFLYIALFKKNKQMLLVSKTLDMSKEILKRVRAYVESNEILKNLKPAHHELTWTKTEINTVSNCVLFCKPYSDNIRTWHVDYCFLDEAAFYEDKSVFYYIIVPTLQFKNANLMVASTPKTLVDLINELAKRKDYWSKTYPIMKNNKPIWPEKYPIIKINQIKNDVGSAIKFDREYLCRVTSEQSALIPVSYIERACDDNMTMVEAGESDKKYYAGFDFALSATGNYSVFTVIEQVEGKLVIKYMERSRGADYKYQEARIKEIYKRFPFILGVADKGSFGRIIVEDLQGEDLPIDGFDTQNKKEDLFLKLRSKFGKENSILIIPTNVEEPYTKKMSDILIKELSEIIPIVTRTGYETYGKAGAYNDTVIALSLAVYASDQIVEVEPMIEMF